MVAWEAKRGGIKEKKYASFPRGKSAGEQEEALRDLAYDKDDRAARRAGRIREKLDWEPGILNGDSWKPKGMHRNTFQRLTAQHDAFVQVSLPGIAALLRLLGEPLDDWV